MKKTLVIATLAGVLTQLASAQEITPKWFQHINEIKNVDATNQLPILKKAGEPTENLNGTELMDAYSQLIRYDATRLLLGVRENGIDETDPNLSPADAATAAAYPDRSLIWIDAATGKPLGLAWKESLHPTLDIGIDVTTPEHGEQGSNYAWWRVGLDEGPVGQRALYSAFKHIILRYAPKPGGGWETTPTVAHEEEVPNVGDGLTNGDGYKSFRLRNFRVRGSGTNTVIMAGGGTWRAGMHPQLLVTTDGLNFTPKARVNDRDGARRNGYSFGGTSAFPVQYGTDPSRPKLSVVYSGHFPATGYGARPDRYTADLDKPTPSPAYNQQTNVYLFSPDVSGSAGFPAFTWEAAGKDGLPLDHSVDGVTRYDGNWNGALASDGKLNYVVAYSMPSWDNQFGDIKKPAWLAIHTLNGSIASGKSAYKLGFTEVDEEVADQAPTGHDYLYDPWLEVYPDTNAPANLGKSEILVTFGTAGFGVFSAENVPAVLVSSPGNQSVEGGTDVTIAADVTGSPNDFQWYRNGVPLPLAPYYLGTKKVVLQIKGVTPADAGAYQLKWVNPLSGAGQTVSATLTVTTPYTRWIGTTDIGNYTIDIPGPTALGEIITNANSFTIKGSGFAAFANANGVGDSSTYRYEPVAGDFDKVVRLISLASEPAVDPIETAARAGLMVRESTNANTRTYEIAAFNPTPANPEYTDANRAGANIVRVAGRGRVDQTYSQQLSRNYAGVAANLPNQWLRIRRVGDAWSFFVGTNGVSWSLISEQYLSLAPVVMVGTFAAPDNAAGDSLAVAEFANYGDYKPADAVAPTLVSVGTIDKKVIGVKFSEAVSAQSATKIGNYSISEGTILSARPGISANTVYLTVFGLNSTTFTVTVKGGVVDLSGNAVAANSTASGKVSNWTSTDIGYIQNPGARPTPGDDPYLEGHAVAVSSDANPEFDIVGGGSNAYNPGDFVHYLYRSYDGDFDVAVAVERFDKRGYAGGYGNGGIHVRSALYREDNAAIAENTKVPAFVNITYYEASGPNRAAIMLNRNNAGEGYGNGAGNIDNNVVIDGLTGFFTGLTAIDAAGTISPTSSPTEAKWLRVKRVGTTYTALLSYDGVTWIEMADSSRVMDKLSGTVLVGFAHQNDTGYGVPPSNTYGGSGTTVPVLDENGDPTGDTKPSQNESSYGVVRISHFGDYVAGAAPTVSVSVDGSDVVFTYTGTLQSSTTVDGTYSAVAGTSPLRVPISTLTGSKFYRASK